MGNRIETRSKHIEHVGPRRAEAAVVKMVERFNAIKVVAHSMHTTRLLMLFFAVLFAGWLGGSGSLVDGQDRLGDAAAAEDARTADEGGATTTIRPADISRYGPAVRAVFEAERKTPGELLAGVLLLIDLGEPELAKPLFARLSSGDLDSAAHAALARKFGSDSLLRLARAKALGPDAAQFADACMSALTAEVRNPDRLAKLISQLDANDPHVRAAAISDIVEAGQVGAAACIEALADPKHANRRLGLIAVLEQLRPGAVSPLISALDLKEAYARVSTIEALGEVAPRRATAYLLAPALIDPDRTVRSAASAVLFRTNGRLPSPAEAQSVLAKTVEAFLAGQLPSPPDEDGMIEIWTWNQPAADQQSQLPKLVSLRVSARDASVVAAGRLAADLASLSPGNVEYQTLSLLCKLQMAKLAGGLDLPLSEAVIHSLSGFDAALIDRVLATAMRRDFIPAAIAAAELLGARGEPAVLHAHSPAIAPLVEALRHGDRRLRFAALTAIVHLAPTQTFAGANRVPEALEFFLRAGRRVAIVAMPDRQRAQTIAGWLSSDGFEATPVASGREAVRLAWASPGVEVALVDAAIAHPGAREVLYQFRGNPGTRRVPFGLLAGPSDFEKAARVATGDRWTKNFSRPQAKADVDRIVESLAAVGGRGQIQLEVRRKQAASALDAIGKILDQAHPIYEVRRLESAVQQAVSIPELGDRAVAVLGHFGSPANQRMLVDLASQDGHPISRREAAAAAFRKSAARFGVQLSREQILNQYDRYNASETSDRPTQIVLGHVLDTIEWKGKTPPTDADAAVPAP